MNNLKLPYLLALGGISSTSLVGRGAFGLEFKEGHVEQRTKLDLQVERGAC